MTGLPSLGDLAFDALPCAAAILNPEGKAEHANAAWALLCDVNGGQVPGEVALVIRACLASAPGSAQEWRQRVAQGDCHVRCFGPEGGTRLLVTIIGHRRDPHPAAHTAPHDLAALVRTSKEPIMSYDLEGRIVTWNRAAAELYGYTADEIIGQSMEVLYPEDWPYGILHYRDLILAGELEEFEVVRKAKSGALRHVSVTAAPVYGPDGAVTAISNFHRDITHAKEAEEHLLFLTRELSHRTKNLLAVVAAIERQAAEGAKSIGEFHAKFSNRISSLIESDRLLSEKEWAPVKIDHLARAQLAVFAPDPEEAADMEGPDITLVPQAVQLIGLSLHELGTNAVKYGALSEHGGHIRLSWRLSSATDSGGLEIIWTETSPAIGGPPDHTGMGHRVVTGLAARSLEGEAELTFEPGALTWRIAIPAKFYQS